MDRAYKEKLLKEKKAAEQSLVQVQNDFKSEQNVHANLETELKDTKSKLAQTEKTLETLKKNHDEETKSLFENKHTLKFVKQMKHYK
jgi:predicted  nucleic acid-binding Zn-ribbon protein